VTIVFVFSSSERYTDAKQLQDMLLAEPELSRLGRWVRKWKNLVFVEAKRDQIEDLKLLILFILVFVAFFRIIRGIWI